MDVTIGGQRLGSGNKQKAYLRNYERSTHDLSYVWRSTMASGTLVPFMTELALPGDTFDIDLECDILTHPTIGPLFGSYKVQLDVFQIPIRLYQAKLHMNLLGVGLDMSKIALPQIKLEGNVLDTTKILDNQHVSPSCIFSYLGIRGIGASLLGNPYRLFNAVPYLAYWDIYKNYYANKQEEIGAVIHRVLNPPALIISTATIRTVIGTALAIPIDDVTLPYTYTIVNTNSLDNVLIVAPTLNNEYWVDGLIVSIIKPDGTKIDIKLTELFLQYNISEDDNSVTFFDINYTEFNIGFGNITYDDSGFEPNENLEPQIVTFPLENIDNMKKDLLQFAGDDAFVMDTTTLDTPYSYPLLHTDVTAGKLYGIQQNQEGLALKTYQSDLFNNWINTEWMDGTNGINAITSITVVDDKFTIDELNLSKKIYDMLNRIALSGGSYDDWLDAVYTHERTRSVENPMYIGGLIKELVFQEVISNSASGEQPLGTLAGRGRLNSKHKGGKIIAKVDEPSYIMGIISLTPRIDYSQGNKWDTNLQSLNDLHKPALDEIGFQPLITDQMAWWETMVDTGVPSFKSAGKQPAWTNYMTNVNIVRGNFADQEQQMFMTLNRRYEHQGVSIGASIKDLTTYIDPSKFNHIFAYTKRDAQNFWAQIGVNITARRKMSAKVMPNL